MLLTFGGRSSDKTSTTAGPVNGLTEEATEQFSN